MTILSPSKKPSQDTRRRTGRKKSKKRRRKEGIILSIKNGAVKLPEKKTKSKGEKTATDQQNGLLKASYKVDGLKLRIKTFSDVSASPKQDLSDAHTGSSPVKGMKHSEIVPQDLETKTAEPLKPVNGIVIVKDKSGKFSAEKLKKKKSKKRDSAFDCLNDIGIWKVMPSPRPDRGTDILKLKLSPHKPKYETAEECNSVKYLGIPVKPRNELSSEDFDILELPSYDKEPNTVNDSGIEVSSSSSCNNGNSVHSVVLDENSPNYFNTEDSLLSFDSPYGDSVNKSEHSICQRCGGIILESNNNTRSPGKCRCYLSNPNSPFQTPISPVKLSDIQKTQDGTILPSGASPHLDSDKLEHAQQRSENKPDNADKTAESICNLPFTKYQASDRTCESDCENNDIIILSSSCNKKVTSPGKEYKGKLKLKLRTTDQSKSSVKKEWEAASPVEVKVDSVSVDNEENPPVEKHRKRLFSESEKQHNNKNNINIPDSHKTITDKTAVAESEHSQEVPEKTKSLLNVETLMSVRSGSISCPVVIDNDVEVTANSELDSRPVSDRNKLSKKRPLFKSKTKRSDKTVNEVLKDTEVKHPVHVVESEPNSDMKSQNEEKPVKSSKRPLFKKAVSVDESSEPVKKKPLFKRNKTSQVISNKAENKTETDKSLNEANNSVDLNKEAALENVKSIAEEQVIKKEERTEARETSDKTVVNSSKGSKAKKASENSEKSSDTDKTTAKPVLSNPLDLFQQQFLSFLSSNKPAVSDNNRSETVVEDEDPETKIDTVHVDENSKNTLPASENTEPFNIDNSPVLETRSECETGTGVVKNSESISLSNSDSFSWLKIFNDTSSKKDEDKSAAKAVPDSADIGVELASINKKMDHSDDDTDSLDMDDVFNLDGLSALKPKPAVEKVKVQRQTSEDRGTRAVPYRRRQKAKRTGPKHRPIKKTMDLDFVYSDDSSFEAEMNRGDSDPDFHPNDSDDDFVKKAAPVKRRSSRTCSRSSRRQSIFAETYDGSSDCVDISDGETNASRNVRRKQGKKSCCPCCLSDQRSLQDSKDCLRGHHHNVESYKLPRNHKQFIRSTLRLLQVQQKLHSLCLTLFPDCAEIINSCKVGTNEFVELIDDILNAVSEPDQQFVSLYPEISVDTKQSKSEYGECPVNSIDLSLTSPDSASRPSEIDFASNEEKSGERSVFKALEPVNSRSYLFSPTSTSFTESKSSLKFENNTLADDAGSENSNSPGKQLRTAQDLPKTSSQSLLSIVSNSANKSGIFSNSAASSHSEQTSCSASPASCTGAITEPSAGTAATLDSIVSYPRTNPSDCNSLPFDSASYYPSTEQSVPMVNITIDLNAARVTLCNNPKSCLDKVHSQIVRLTQYVLPGVEFKNYFYKNLDNLEFLIDLLIEANTGREIVIDQEQEDESELKTLWAEERISDPVYVPETDNLTYSFIVTEPDTLLADQEIFFTDDYPGNDLFKEKIKLQRESLKRDLFVIEEDVPVYSTDVSEKVLDSIETYHKQTQKKLQKRPREGRPRKRSADEKRTLFVQEKLMNTHSSTFVCASNNRVPEGPVKKGRKQKHAENTKEHFLSELNLGDKAEKALNVNVNKIEHNISYETLTDSATDVLDDSKTLPCTERRQSGFSEEGKNIFELITNA